MTENVGMYSYEEEEIERLETLCRERGEVINRIHTLLDGEEWGSETMSEVAEVITDYGLTIRDPNDEPKKRYRISWVEYHTRLVCVEGKLQAYAEVGERTDDSLIEWETTEVIEEEKGGEQSK